MADLETRVAVLEARMEVSGSGAERMVRDMGILQDRVLVLSERVSDVREEMAHLRGEVRAQIGDLRGEMGTLRGEIAEQFTKVHKEFAILHRESANQTKFLLALVLGAATLISVLQPLLQKVLR